MQVTKVPAVLTHLLSVSRKPKHLCMHFCVSCGRQPCSSSALTCCMTVWQYTDQQAGEGVHMNIFPFLHAALASASLLMLVSQAHGQANLP